MQWQRIGVRRRMHRATYGQRTNRHPSPCQDGPWKAPQDPWNNRQPRTGLTVHPPLTVRGGLLSATGEIATEVVEMTWGTVGQTTVPRLAPYHKEPFPMLHEPEDFSTPFAGDDGVIECTACDPDAGEPADWPAWTDADRWEPTDVIRNGGAVLREQRKFDRGFRAGSSRTN